MNDLRRVLREKRDGRALSAGDCAAFLRGVAQGTIGEAEQAALLASIWFRGMNSEELAAWTDAMVHSGETLDLSSFDAPKVDKHSTGGVGDKVSLPLAPILSAVGCLVPMISGRGLGHTGGTLDKLEAVPGVATALDSASIRRVLREAGCVICAQTETIAPADRVLYSLRDRVELVESLPLIASSIVSKKVAEGIDALVLDVKAGSGSFLIDRERARELARTMVHLAESADVRASARITWMGRPLGRAVGHALEIRETLDFLRGAGGPADLDEIVTAFAVDLVMHAGLAASESAAEGLVRRAIDDGSAAERFDAMLAAQGADLAAPLPKAPDVFEWKADRAGLLAFDDVREVGYAVAALGGGRLTPSDVIDPAVGIVWQRAAGERVERGDPLCLIEHRAGRGLDEAAARLSRAVFVSEDGSGGEPELLLERIDASDRTD